MIFNKDLKNMRANAVSAVGYIIRNVVLAVVLILIVTVDWEQFI